MDPLIRDIRYAVRSLARTPMFTAIAALCIALGIAANVFVWSPVNALLLRPLPYQDPERLMHLSSWRTNEARQPYGSWSYPDFSDVARGMNAFSSLAAWTSRTWNLGGMEDPERVQGARVTATLFPMLGLQPALGRFFRADEDEAGKVMVLGHGLWQRKFGGDPSVVGRTLRVNGDPYTVVGVMREGIRFPETGDMWLPLEPGDAREHREWRFYQVVGRLAPGVTESQANERLAAFVRPLEERFPDSNRGWSAWLQPLSEDVAGQVRPIFLIMVGAVGFVLLIACANVANLLLARGSARQREIAVRYAMGASRARIVRQLLTESILLALLGGGIGIFLGSFGIELFTERMMPSEVPFWMTFGVDGRVLAITTAIVLAAGIIFGLAPALQLSRTSVAETIKESGGRAGSASARIGRTRNALVVSELALSLVLLVGAALMVQSFLKSRTANLGLRAENLLTMQLALAGDRYESDSTYLTVLGTLEREIAALPGVSRVGAVGQLPIGECCNGINYFPEGKDYPAATGPTATINAVSPSFFATMEIPLLQGRVFDARDHQAAPRVAIINETFARAEWPGASAIGRRFKESPNDSVWRTVVGVVPGVVQRRLNEPRSAQAYYPMAQMGWRNFSLAVRTEGDPLASIRAVRETIKRIDPDLPLAQVKTMDQVVRDRMFEGAVYGSMFAIFAVTALILASIGLYGVMSYAVSQRTHELGVRMALGARREDVLTLVLGGALRLIGVGLLIGVPAAIGLSQLLRGTLYGVSATDPLTFVLIPTVLAGVALAATYVPARRATRVDPAIALRSE